MSIKIVILLLALFNGGWMIFDGFHVIRKGKYFGPPTPGAWSKIVSKLGVDPLSIGPVFVVLGALWVLSAIAVVAVVPVAWLALVVIAIATLWYIKVGTVISMLVLALLFIFKSNLGYL